MLLCPYINTSALLWHVVTKGLNKDIKISLEPNQTSQIIKVTFKLKMSCEPQYRWFFFISTSNIEQKNSLSWIFMKLKSAGKKERRKKTQLFQDMTAKREAEGRLKSPIKKRKLKRKCFSRRNWRENCPKICFIFFEFLWLNDFQTLCRAAGQSSVNERKLLKINGTLR